MIRFQILAAPVAALFTTAAHGQDDAGTPLPPTGAVRFNGKAATAEVLVCLRTGPATLDCFSYEDFVKRLNGARGHGL